MAGGASISIDSDSMCNIQSSLAVLTAGDSPRRGRAGSCVRIVATSSAPITRAIGAEPRAGGSAETRGVGVSLESRGGGMADGIAGASLARFSTGPEGARRAIAVTDESATRTGCEVPAFPGRAVHGTDGDGSTSSERRRGIGMGRPVRSGRSVAPGVDMTSVLGAPSTGAPRDGKSGLSTSGTAGANAFVELKLHGGEPDEARSLAK